MASWRMQSTASALGVIAIVSVMITATASEVESGFDHPGNSEDSLDFPSGERTSNESVIKSSERVNRIFLKDDTIITAASKKMLMVTTSRSDVRGEIDVDGSETDAMVQIDRLQRDQSETRGTHIEQNDSEGEPSRTSGQDGSQQGTYDEHFVEDSSSLRSTPTETTSIDLAEVFTLGGTFIENQNVRQSAAAASKRTDNRADESAVIDDQVENEALKIDKQELTDDTTNGSLVRANSSVSAGETLRGSKDGKDAENLRTPSFQVSSANGQADTVSQVLKPGKNGPGKIDGPGKSIESRKDHSRPANNLLVSGKSTKAFYEIKPSIKTEINGRRDQPTTSTAQAGRRFVLPSVDSAFGKFGPYFEDGQQEINMTARIGTTVLLDCKIGMLGDKKVTWVQHVKDSFRLLTVGRIPYSVDQRISLQFRYPSNWRLQILYATPRDSGLYQCQVATHPPLVKKINVIVTAPVLTITDDSGRTVAKERHLKAGSALRLRCEARDVLESQNESVVWTRGDETLAEDVSENRTTEISVGKEVLVIVSTLIVERASPRHAGNYSCLVPGKAKTTIAVHVLNGELPAAVHDGSGVSRAVLNLWLIHLTVSYVFFR